MIKQTIKYGIVFMMGLIIGSLFFVSSEVSYCMDGDGQGNDWGCIDFDYELNSNIVNRLNNRPFVNELIVEDGFTRITYDFDAVDNDNVREVVESYDYQHTALQHQAVDLQGLNVYFACGRDFTTNQLYGIYIDNGQFQKDIVEDCNI